MGASANGSAAKLPRGNPASKRPSPDGRFAGIDGGLRLISLRLPSLPPALPRKRSLASQAGVKNGTTWVHASIVG